MGSPKVCLTLTAPTIEEDLELLNRYRNKIDIAELRVDHLLPDERLHVRKFPGLAGLPCILTIRRQIDGGQFVEGEAARTILFARALSFAEEDKTKNFEYVDFEEDFHIPSLEDATLAFGTKIIRSVHDMKNPIININDRLASLNKSGYEIPKIAFMPHSLDDVKNLFEQASLLKDSNHILIAMGALGTPTRILGSKLKNYLTYTSTPETLTNTKNIAHIDVITLNDTYHIKQISENTKIFGITGWPLSGTSSPALHNAGYEKNGLDAVYIPICAEKFSQAMDFAECIGVKGLSVTVPHKEEVLNSNVVIDETVSEIGASNTLVKNENDWIAFNTDAEGFQKSLLEFTGLKNLKRKKVAIIGAGGAARAIAYAVHKLKGDACVFNRTLSKAKKLAEQFNFKYSILNQEAAGMLKKYSDIIIQTTSKGMHSTDEPNQENDPLFFYDFSGKEMVFDIIYMPETTPIMKRAKNAGCKVCNGFDMLRYQGYKQFELYTGVEY